MGNLHFVRFTTLSMRSSVPEAYQVIASCLAAVSFARRGSGDQELTRSSSQTESVLLTIHGLEGEEEQEQHAIDAGNMLVSLLSLGFVRRKWCIINRCMLNYSILSKMRDPEPYICHAYTAIW